MTAHRTTRRTVLAGAASVPVAALAGAVPASAVTADDTSTRIQEHCAVQSKISQMLKRLEVLEETIPIERRENHSIVDRGTDVGANDDPRWKEWSSEYWAHEDRLDELSWSFVDRPPSSVAGIQALLSYASEYEEAGHEWPDCRHHFEDGCYAGYTLEDWRAGVMAAVLAWSVDDPLAWQGRA